MGNLFEPHLTSRLFLPRLTELRSVYDDARRSVKRRIEENNWTTTSIALTPHFVLYHYVDPFLYYFQDFVFFYVPYTYSSDFYARTGFNKCKYRKENLLNFTFPKLPVYSKLPFYLNLTNFPSSPFIPTSPCIWDSRVTMYIKLFQCFVVCSK